MSRLSLPSGELFYATRGAGEPLLFLHGAGGSWKQWAAVLRALADQGWQGSALEWPGRGHSPSPARRQVAALGALVVESLDALRLARATLVGHSLGGAVALWVARYHPDRVARLALVSSALPLPVETTLLAALAAPQPDPTLHERLARRSYAPGTPAPLLERAAQALRALPPGTLLADYEAAASFTLPEPQRVALPTLVVGGRSDAVTPPAAVAGLAATLPAATLCWLDGVGHMPLLEAPEVLAATLAGWLNATPVAR